MISSEEMLAKLVEFADIGVERAYNDRGLHVTYDVEELRKLVDEAEVFIDSNLNDFVEEKVNCAKKASTFELMIRHKRILQTGDLKEDIFANSRYAMAFASYLILDEKDVAVDVETKEVDLSLDTLKPTVVDYPLNNCMYNHFIWLLKLNVTSERELPVFINAAFWSLVSIIHSNKENFYSVGN